VAKVLLYTGIALLFLAPPRARAGDAYFVLVFGAERPDINRPCYTHSWATFVRVSCADSPAVEAFTISWMPRNLQIRPWALLPEAGVNLDLSESLAWADGVRVRVSLWGPYQIDRALYERAAAKRARLDSGEVRFKSNDAAYNSDTVSNCVKAVADVAEGPRVRVGQPGWGESASYFVVQSYRPFLLDPSSTHDWLLDQLGLASVRFVRRSLDENPTRSPVLRAAQNLLNWRLRP
jgi:hypothetical protein